MYYSFSVGGEDRTHLLIKTADLQSAGPSIRPSPTYKFYFLTLLAII